MAGESALTSIGNLTADPELRTTGGGATVASFTIASTPRNWNRQTNQFEDGQALFMRCSAWGDMAGHCVQSLKKGMRVIAQGRLRQHSYQAQDGSQRTVIDMTVDEIGPSLRYATAAVNRVQSGRGYSGGSTYGDPAKPANQQQGWQNGSPAQNPGMPEGDPWAQPAPGGPTGPPPLLAPRSALPTIFHQTAKTPNSKEIQYHERKRPMACRTR